MISDLNRDFAVVVVGTSSLILTTSLEVVWTVATFSVKECLVLTACDGMRRGGISFRSDHQRSSTRFISRFLALASNPST